MTIQSMSASAWKSISADAVMLCRLNPWPEPVIRAFSRGNLKIYNPMQGKSEFEVTGNLRNWERGDRLREIEVRTLTPGARYDEMNPGDIVKMAEVMLHATSAICPNGSHMCMWDDPAVHFPHPLGFLRSIEFLVPMCWRPDRPGGARRIG
jgi:proline iminopeptidase